MQPLQGPHGDRWKSVAEKEGQPARTKGTAAEVLPLSVILSMPILVHAPKSRKIAFLLCLFFGWLGCHRFYVGKRGSGRLYLLTSGLLFLGVVVDLVRILDGSFEDRFGRPLA